ncbi:hypothetical protein Mro03_06310 [Microbispora rosea subsp. rosea]|nr:hypothetical protein Mro03_06310 [Microbispora rosea subsp. rosea]
MRSPARDHHNISGSQVEQDSADLQLALTLQQDVERRLQLAETGDVHLGSPAQETALVEAGPELRHA